MERPGWDAERWMIWRGNRQPLVDTPHDHQYPLPASAGPALRAETDWPSSLAALRRASPRCRMKPSHRHHQTTRVQFCIQLPQVSLKWVTRPHDRMIPSKPKGGEIRPGMKSSCVRVFLHTLGSFVFVSTTDPDRCKSVRFFSTSTTSSSTPP